MVSTVFPDAATCEKMRRECIGQAAYFDGFRLGTIIEVRWAATADGYQWTFRLDNGAVLRDFREQRGCESRWPGSPDPTPAAGDDFPEECPTGQAGACATRSQRHCAGCRHIQHTPHPRCTWPAVAPEHIAAIAEMMDRLIWQPQLPGL
jgi:hypothetical protein